ncbi:8-oxo-dGTP diphosphatase [Lactobacillus corticis]|uniref:DNA mismatch repair protein MutT n=1 Tax=Lactobacillus corticis TaxID=2201249 RepID=A0A916VHU6_9LACO|nr:8-oxo-dGTP diphosphatase [Lactobacillus corticis]GFZ27047.1 DNA mismatch repair protein MutT [Lactobacillus corticis]
MSRYEEVTLTNMCMIVHDQKVLTIRRNDPVWPGLTFPGGHVEAGESFNHSVIREVAEETGLTIFHPKLVGIKQFNDQNDHRYLVLFYRADSFTGTLQPSKEGNLAWLSLKELEQEKLARDFENDLPVFLNSDLSEHFFWNDINECY